MTDDFISYVETRFRDLMLNEYPDMELHYSNEDSATGDTYCVVHVVASGDVIPLALGINADSRNVGFIQIDIWTPKDIGAGASRRIAKYASTMFHRHTTPITTEGHATFKDAATKDMKIQSGKHMRYVTIPYRYDFVQERATA